MRELSLSETVILAGLLLLSLVLPVLLSVRNPRDATMRRTCLRTIWIGQMLGVSAGLLVLASTCLAPYAAAFGVLSYLACAAILTRQFRAIH